MKRTILFLAMLLTMAAVRAQELTVTYAARYNTSSPTLFAEAGLPEDMRSAMVNAFKDVVMTYRLLYKDGESDYRIVPSDEKQEITFMGRKMDVNAMTKMQAQNYTYKNHKTGEQRDFTAVFGKKFIVCDSLPGKAFTVSEGEKKEILGYECRKAVSPDGKTIVWFTSGIPVKDEPVACGLNGLVLEFSNGTNIFTAKSISMDKITTPIVRPEGEKEMQKKDFDEMVKKRMEMMKR